MLVKTLLVKFLHFLSLTILQWMFSGSRLSIWALINFALWWIVFEYLISSKKIETVFEKIVVIGILISLFGLELLIVSIIWMDHSR